MNKVLLKEPPGQGWIPEDNTVYIGNYYPYPLYVPLPSPYIGLGVSYLNDGALRDILLHSHGLDFTPALPVAGDTYGVTLDYIKSTSPFVLNISYNPATTIAITVKPAYDTQQYSEIATGACNRRFNTLTKLYPSHVYDFKNPYIVDGISTWYDKVSYTPISSEVATIAYPSAQLDVSLYGMLIPPNEEVFLPQLEDSDKFAIMLNVSSGDGKIIEIANILVLVYLGIIKIVIDGIEYDTNLALEQVAGTTQPGYEIGLVYLQGQLSFIYEGKLANTFAIPHTANVGLNSVLDTKFPISLSTRMISSLIIYNHFSVSIADLLCSTTTTPVYKDNHRLVDGNNCNKAKVIVQDQVEWIASSNETMRRNIQVVFIAGKTGGAVSVTVSNEGTVIYEYRYLNLQAHEQKQLSLFVDDNNELSYTILTGEVQARILQLEEH